MDLARSSIRDIISQVNGKLIEERVFKLTPEEILVISSELEDVLENM